MLLVAESGHEASHEQETADRVTNNLGCVGLTHALHAPAVVVIEAILARRANLFVFAQCTILVAFLAREGSRNKESLVALLTG